MLPEDIPTGSFTHINFAFVFVDPKTFEIAPMPPDPNDSVSLEDLFKRVTDLKAIKPGLQVWISVGGWSMNDPNQPTYHTFSDLASSTDAQSKFSKYLLSFMQTHGFDGVDIDWEYPGAPERGGKSTDYGEFVIFLDNLRRSIGHNYGLSITLPSSYWYMRNFDISALAKIVDWFNVMTYDLHGTWDQNDKHVGSIVNAHTNLTEIDQTLDLTWRNDVDPQKVVLGIGFYGRSFTLKDKSCTKPGCLFTEGGTKGSCTNSSGTLSYSEMQGAIGKGAKVEFDHDAAVKIVTWDDQWVSYDDRETLGMKMKYANSRCLGGTMVWAVSLDVVGPTAPNPANSGNAAHRVRSIDHGRSGEETAADLSVWTGRKRQSLETPLTVPKAIDSFHLTMWIVWKGTAPQCGANKCPADKPIDIASSTTGDNQQICSATKNLKHFCCTDPPPYTGCDWYTDGEKSPPPSPRPAHCSGKCPQHKVLIATDEMCFFGGTRALCCDPPSSPKNEQVLKYQRIFKDFVDNPTCPAKLPYSKHSESAEANSGDLVSRAILTLPSFPILKTTFASFNRDTMAKVNTANAFNDVFQPVMGINDSSVLEFVDQERNTQDDTLPRFDPVHSMEKILCQTEPDEVLECRREVIRELCLLPPGPQKRIFFEDIKNIKTTKGKGRANDDPDEPHTAAVMQAIIDNTIPLLYITQLSYRPARHNAGAPGDWVDLELEAVWDIRAHPELQSLNRQLANPHDLRPDGDRFVSIHFHTQGMVQRAHARDSNDAPTPIYPEITSIPIYHGQHVFQNTMVGGGYSDTVLQQPADPELATNPGAFPRNKNDWRVDFRQVAEGSANERVDIASCHKHQIGPEYDRLGAMNPGYPGNNAAGPGICNKRLVNFLKVLYNRGITHPSTYTRWTDGHRWYPQYGDSPNIGPWGGPPPANMADFRDLNNLRDVLAPQGFRRSGSGPSPPAPDDPGEGPSTPRPRPP